MNLTDAYMTVTFLKRLVTPFDRWRAFDLKLIDADGNLLKKRADMTDAERSAFGTFDLLVRNVKMALLKVPGGLGHALTLAAAVRLVGEGRDADLTDLVDRILSEDGAPTNSAGSGQVAGIGVGPQGEPPAGKGNLFKRAVSRRRGVVRK